MTLVMITVRNMTRGGVAVMSRTFMEIGDARHDMHVLSCCVLSCPPETCRWHDCVIVYRRDTLHSTLVKEQWRSSLPLLLSDVLRMLLFYIQTIIENRGVMRHLSPDMINGYKAFSAIATHSVQIRRARDVVGISRFQETRPCPYLISAIQKTPMLDRHVALTLPDDLAIMTDDDARVNNVARVLNGEAR
jgi:hypothetical protein